jgi:hypothetical protein
VPWSARKGCRCAWGNSTTGSPSAARDWRICRACQGSKARLRTRNRSARLRRSSSTACMSVSLPGVTVNQPAARSGQKGFRASCTLPKPFSPPTAWSASAWKSGKRP